MGNNTIDDLLVTLLWHIEYVSCFMEYCLTARYSLNTVEYLVNINLLIAAAVFIH